MRTVHALCLVVPVALFTAAAAAPRGAAPAPAVPALNAVDRSPTDLALSADGNWAVTANRTADTASLVDLRTGKRVGEVSAGDGPFAVALTPGGTRAVVTGHEGNTLAVLALGPGRLAPERTIPVGDGPRGVCVSPDGKRAYVALSGEDAVAVVDLEKGTVIRRADVPAEPWHVALTPDSKRLIVGCSKARTVALLDAATLAPIRTVRTFSRNLRHLAVSGDGAWAYVPGIAERGMGVSQTNIDRGWIIGNRLNRVPLGEAGGPREAITLDVQGNAVGDVDGCAISPDGRMVALAAGGTHELLLLSGELPFVSYGGPGDHIDTALGDDRQRFRRIRLGGRPIAARWTPDGKRIAVANYLLNTVQIVDAATGTVSATIPLGGPETPSLARRGEAIFTDATRSFHSWYSCSTCHVEGHSNGGSYDTLNDGGYGKPKKTLSLRGIARTAPYTWHGWQAGLRDGIRGSLEKTMQAEKEPTEADVDAVEAYFKTLTWRRSPFCASDGSLTAAARRGERVFAEKACATCHTGPDFAGAKVVTVGLEEDDDRYKGFNPPPLRGLYDRAPYLHDGRADTLEEVLTRWHRPSQLTGKPDCTEAELADLVAFLKSL
jgi:YVTN family beta-propeller protein